jgi:hypothetical protein
VTFDITNVNDERAGVDFDLYPEIKQKPEDVEAVIKRDQSKRKSAR